MPIAFYILSDRSILDLKNNKPDISLRYKDPVISSKCIRIPFPNSIRNFEVNFILEIVIFVLYKFNVESESNNVYSNHRFHCVILIKKLIMKLYILCIGCICNIYFLCFILKLCCKYT
jgi:hypothetical protein